MIKIRTNKLKISVVVIMLFLSVFSITDTTFAAKLENCDMPDNELIKILDVVEKVDNGKVKAVKLSNVEKNNVLSNVRFDMKQEIDVYVIQRKIDNNNIMQTTIANVPVNSNSNGQATNNKEGRVSVSCTINYERKKFNGIDHYKGTSFGGRVMSSQNGIAVTRVEGKYVEYGGFFTSSGSQGYTSPQYNLERTFDLARCKQYQSGSVSTGKYYNTSQSATGQVQAMYTAFYRSSYGGNINSISVTSSVPSSI